jgi:hypothetical protein
MNANATSQTSTPAASGTLVAVVPGETDLGQNIVVLDRGFVYVGQVTERSDRLVIRNARNLRRWGTTNGLGQLRNGPLVDTVLDDCGEVHVYLRAVISLIPATGF